MGRLVRAVFVGLALGVVSACGDPRNIGDCDCCGYVTCYENTVGTKGSLDSTYGAHGSCWSTTTAAATACTDACKSGYAALKSAYPDAGC